ncbi:unnamed protein product [Prunus armeniaca]
MFLWITVRSCRIRRIVKRSPGYSGNANPRVRDVYPSPRKTYRNSREARVLRPSIRSRRDPLRVKLCGITCEWTFLLKLSNVGSIIWSALSTKLCTSPDLNLVMMRTQGILEGMLLWTLDLG